MFLLYRVEAVALYVVTSPGAFRISSENNGAKISTRVRARVSVHEWNMQNVPVDNLLDHAAPGLDDIAHVRSILNSVCSYVKCRDY